MIIPYQQLSSEALLGLIQAFILREGTDYGEVEQSLEEKIAQVRAQVQEGAVLVVFDEASESASLVNESDYSRLERERETFQQQQHQGSSKVAERQSADKEYWEYAQTSYDDNGEVGQ